MKRGLWETQNGGRNSAPQDLELRDMGQPQFVHLHVHTDYSLLDGACETSELLDEASRQKMPAVAITDHGNLFAAANFFYEASKRDVKPTVRSVAKANRARAEAITWCFCANRWRVTTI
jgi:DNA polymerase III alpha subunit